MRRFNIFAARVGAHGVLGRHHGTPLSKRRGNVEFFHVSSFGALRNRLSFVSRVQPPR